MLTPLDSNVDALRKHFGSLLRAVPVTRMLDYGVPLEDALAVHGAGPAEVPPAWDMLCEDLAQRRIAIAQALKGDRQVEAPAWRAASALLQCGQLAFNHDDPRKKDLYGRAHAAMERHAALSVDLRSVVLPTPRGPLHGWVVSPRSGHAHAAVVVLGGLSGWGAVYLDMGRALAARGVVAILGEGPGQGLSRLRGGLHLDAGSLPLLGHFVDLASDLTTGRVGVWGNSFGGLFAAHLAVLDPRVKALCVNGAPMRPGVPGFRTAREQMHAVFGTASDDELAERLGALSLDPQRHRTDAAMLVVQGGRDELVPMGSQEDFLALTSSQARATLDWHDGEHTIYNHAAERNDRVSDWFVHHLRAGGSS